MDFLVFPFGMCKFFSFVTVCYSSNPISSVFKIFKFYYAYGLSFWLIFSVFRFVIYKFFSLGAYRFHFLASFSNSVSSVFEIFKIN